MEAVNSVITCSATVGVVLSIIMYGFGVWLRDKTKIDALNPLLISIASIIVFLLVFHVDYKNYEQSAQYLSYLLTPATVALAIPLYKQLEILTEKEYQSHPDRRSLRRSDFSGVGPAVVKAVRT